MHLSEVSETSNDFGDKLQPGDHIKVLKMYLKEKVETKRGIVDIAVFETSNCGNRYSMGAIPKGIVKSEKVQKSLKDILAIDASDGLDLYVTTKIAEPSGNEMIGIEFKNPTPDPAK